MVDLTSVQIDDTSMAVHEVLMLHQESLDDILAAEDVLMGTWDAEEFTETLDDRSGE